MTSANQTGADGECYDLLTADEGTHDTHTTHERPDTQPAGTDAGFMDQEGPAFTVKEKESNFLAHEFIPSSSHTLGSEQHISEGLKYLTQEGLEPDVKTTTPKPAQAFTDESTASQSHGQGLNPAERLQEPETQQFLENKRSDQEDLKQDDENPMTQRSCEYDPEERMPAVVVTQPGEVSSDQAEDINLSVMHEDMVHSDSSRNASPSDGTELSSSDLLSLKSDTISLSDEQEGSEEDTRSITASSVMSLFHRVQMDPIEKEWLRCAALGNASTLYLLLQQDPTLISKKTALHWAAKQGRVEMADMMARSGADVNQRAGYTPLHLASLHGHDKVIQVLINNYNAKVNIRDYHGKMAAHYWNGSKDIFTEHRSHSASLCCCWFFEVIDSCFHPLSWQLAKGEAGPVLRSAVCPPVSLTK